MLFLAGLSRSLEANANQVAVGNQLGTVAYTAPEIFHDSVVTKPSDVYAFGVLSESPHFMRISLCFLGSGFVSLQDEPLACEAIWKLLQLMSDQPVQEKTSAC